MASHSVGATTPTRLPLTTTCALGNRFLSSSPADASLEPSVFGCTMRACSMPGSRASVAHCSFAATLEVITLLRYGLPTIVYSLTGHGQPAHDAGQHPGNRDREVQPLAFHQLAIRDAFGAARKDAVFSSGAKRISYG